ncbi:MAG: C25 family cysteine peptidase [Planctomycetaceae bacterium]|nr:C25 family cysteine peptidase [Planctomycetaceae bacterium]
MSLFFFGQIVIAEQAGNLGRVIVVSPKFFDNSIEQWIKYRTAQGYKITKINADESFTPQQIRNQISIAANNSTIAAILIVGNGVVRAESDRGRVIPSPRLPCQVISEFANDPHLASDDWYADFDNDNRPDCPVGRFPANSIESLDSLIQSTIRYETEIAPDLWCRQFQVVAGVGNFSPLIDHVIESMARFIFTEQLPISCEVAFLYANVRSQFCPSPLDIRNEYLATLNRSPMFWIYAGHGYHRSLQPLDTPHGQIETLSDNSKNQNNFPIFNCKNSLPIVMLLCCYGGTLDAKTKSIAEELLLPENGAVAVIATSRAAMPYSLTVFGTECLNEFTKRQNKSEKILLGTIIFEAKKRMLINIDEIKNPNLNNQNSFRQAIENIAKWLDPIPTKLDQQLAEHVEQIHIFGDPLLTLPQSIPISLNTQTEIKSGEKLKIKGKIQIENDLKNKNNLLEMSVLIDLAISPDQISIRSKRRTKLTKPATETRNEDNDEYKLANQHVIARYVLPISNQDGIFETEIPIPPNLHGKHLIRVFCKLNNAYAIGAVTIHINKISNK